MRIKHFLFLFFPFLLFIGKSEAQTTFSFAQKINWIGVQKWFADSSYINVISFENACYPSDNFLPYFNYKQEMEPSFSYEASIANPVWIPVTPEELKIVEQYSFSPEAEVKSNIAVEKGVSFFNVNILPFVEREGEYFKLLSFDLVIKKTSAPQKAKTSTLHTYATSSVLAQGKFIKIRVASTGVYKITYDDLSKMGIDPANVRIFGYGGGVLEQSFLKNKIDDLPEVAIWMEKGKDGIFNSGDYILFYAQGPVKWYYDDAKSKFVHVNNPYSFYGYYFITSDAGIGKKIEEKTIEIPPDAVTHQITEFTDYQVYEKDQVNLCSSGKEFYGEVFSNVTSYSFSFKFPNIVFTNTTKVTVDVAATSSANSSFSISLNDSQTKSLIVQKVSGDHYEMGKAATGSYTFTPNNETLNFKIDYIKSTSTSVGYLNYIEVNARRRLQMSGSVMQFQNIDYLNKSSNYNNYILSNVNSNIQIWDITDPQNITRVPFTMVNDNTLQFTVPGYELHTYLAIDPTAGSSFSTPETVGKVVNQNLHGLQPVDMVIIVHPNFKSQAENLAQTHREKDNLRVAVATTEEVYNEFSSGSPDATAYRWVMKMFYDRALNANRPDDLPKYLLLFGRGSYDNRGIITNSGDNLILTYQADNSLVITSSYITDDYFGFLDDNEGVELTSNLLDIGVGRFPVSTEQQATDIVNKTVNYIQNKGKGIWKNQLCFLADDGDYALHMNQADSIAVSVAKLYPGYQINKIYLDAFVQEVNASGQSYPVAKSRFQNLLRSGMFLLDFMGHANSGGWTNETILTTADIKNLTNQHLAVWMAATCDFLQFDIKPISAGEHVVLNPSGGGIGLLSAARPVYASQNFYINKYFVESLFKKENENHLRVGDAVRIAKNKIGTEINKLCFVYVGDPAVQLNYPDKFSVVTSKINGNTQLGNDTLKALSVTTIEGYISDNVGNKIPDFNGKIEVVVYDKLQKITTLNNEKDGALTYYDRPNTLFAGKAEVKNGEFTFTFMLPKDIKYNYGTGRINYYAYDDDHDYEAQGYFENFFVGGSSQSHVNDTIGPELTIYLNSPEFVSGGKVNETPLFVAHLEDEHGINAVGSGIGHDLVLIIDENPLTSYILNDYYQSEENSYISGNVSYKLPELKEGKHTLTFRAWDLLNNSSTQTLEFEVVKGLRPVIFSVYNYPNPVQERTKIVINHDRPETQLITTVEIFDITGRKIWSFSQSSIDDITWDLKGPNGKRVQNGIYLYRVSIKTPDSEMTSKTNKIIVVGQ